MGTPKNFSSVNEQSQYDGHDLLWCNRRHGHWARKSKFTRIPKRKGCDDCLDLDARYHQASKTTKATLKPYSHSWKHKGLKAATEDEFEQAAAVTSQAASQVRELSGVIEGGELIWDQKT
jgi:hypothetical protein